MPFGLKFGSREVCTRDQLQQLVDSASAIEKAILELKNSDAPTKETLQQIAQLKQQLKAIHQEIDECVANLEPVDEYIKKFDLV